MPASSTPSSLPFGSAQYRQHFREQVTGRIPGPAYALLVLVLLVVIITALALLIPKYEPYFLVLLPAYFLFVNWLEYLLHRYPMHRKTRGMEVVYEHVTIHHNFYANEYFYFEEPRDYYAAILPWYIFIGLTVVIAAVSGMIYLFFGMSNALFFALVAYSYYLLYEILHFSYHTSEKSWVKKLPFINHLARRHIVHHRTSAMAHYNFNITFPIFDRVYGTLLDDDAKPATARKAQQQ